MHYQGSFRRNRLASHLPNQTTKTCPRAITGPSILLNVKCDQWQVQNQRQPVSINKEQRSQDSVHSSFGDDVGIETVAEIDGVNIIAF